MIHDLKEWVKNQFSEKNNLVGLFGAIKVSIDKDAYILKLREDSVSDSLFTRFTTYFEGDKIRITNGNNPNPNKNEYFTLLKDDNDDEEYVCYQQGELWDKNTTRWTILSMEKVSITEGFYFKKERMIGYDITLGAPLEKVTPCIGLLMGDVQLKF